MIARQQNTSHISNYLKGMSKLFSKDIFMRDVYLCLPDEEIDRIESMIDWYIVGKDIEFAINSYEHISKGLDKHNDRKKATCIQ